MNKYFLRLSECYSWKGRPTATIRSWPRFRRDVRNRHPNLLCRLGEFKDPILVTGCQRSGTTALARAITLSPQITKYSVGWDDELDAAMILAGCIPQVPSGRYCFQTTYLNEQYEEYLEYVGEFRMVWVLRNPFSVIYSMLHNWGRFAFDELYQYCGSKQLETLERTPFRSTGHHSVPRVVKACLSYNAKLSQLPTLHEALGLQNLLILDYDDLVASPNSVLPLVYDFLELEYHHDYATFLTAESVSKADRLSALDRNTIKTLCESVYCGTKELIANDKRLDQTRSSDFGTTDTVRD